MPLRHPVRLAVVSTALVYLSHSPVFAWGILKRHHDDCADTQTIRLPAQRVDIETTAPRITFSETTRVGRGLAPVVGTVYMPLAMPLAGVGSGREADLAREEDYDPLRTAHLAERALLRHEQAKAALRSEVEAKQRVLERLGTSTAASFGAAPADIDKRLTQLSDQINKLTDRVTALEKLTLTHDSYLKEQIRAPKPQP